MAHQFLLNGFVKKTRNQAKHILKQQREALSDCPETSNLSQAFITDEIINALAQGNKGREGCGTRLDLPRHVEEHRASCGPMGFCDDAMTKAKIPKICRSENVIAIRKPGKPLDDPNIATDRSHLYNN